MTDVVIVGEIICNIFERLETQLSDSGVNLIASSEHINDILPLLENHRPRVVIIDFAEQAEISLSLIRLINLKNPSGMVLLISNFTDEELILDGITVGAKGYLEREACGIFLAKAIESIALGEAWLSRKLVAALLDRLTDYSEQTDAADERIILGASNQLH